MPKSYVTKKIAAAAELRTALHRLGLARAACVHRGTDADELRVCCEHVVDVQIAVRAAGMKLYPGVVTLRQVLEGAQS